MRKKNNRFKNKLGKVLLFQDMINYIENPSEVQNIQINYQN